MQPKTKNQVPDDYINNKIKPILENLIVDLLIHKPDDVKEHMINNLQNEIDSFPNKISIQDQKSKIVI